MNKIKNKQTQHIILYLNIYIYINFDSFKNSVRVNHSNKSEYEKEYEKRQNRQTKLIYKKKIKKKRTKTKLYYYEYIMNMYYYIGRKTMQLGNDQEQKQKNTKNLYI